MTTQVNISQTPIAPYIGVLNNMNRKEKMAVALFLVSSIPGVEIVETKEEKPQFTEEDERLLSSKLGDMTFSPRIERLFQKRKEIARSIDLNDERTKHILGL
jgi:hypothetical protein